MLELFVMQCKWWTKSSCTNWWLNPDMRDFYMNKIRHLNRFRTVSHPSAHTKVFSRGGKTLQASYLCKVKLLVGFCTLCKLMLLCQIRDGQEASSKWGIYIFFHGQEIVSVELNGKLKERLQPTVNLILPWWELINISTGMLLHHLNLHMILRKIAFSQDF